MVTKSKLVGGLRMTYSSYLYQSNDNTFYQFYQWDFLADQLNYGPPVNGYPWAHSFLVPRKARYVEPNYGYRLNLVIPNYQSDQWRSQTTVGWFGYLYTSTTWTPEQLLAPM